MATSKQSDAGTESTVRTGAGKKTKLPIQPDELDATALRLVKAALNLTAFSALMRELEIPQLEFNGAGLIQSTEENLQSWYRKVRGNLAEHPSYPDEGMAAAQLRSAS